MHSTLECTRVPFLLVLVDRSANVLVCTTFTSPTAIFCGCITAGASTLVLCPHHEILRMWELVHESRWDVQPQFLRRERKEQAVLIHERWHMISSTKTADNTPMAIQTGRRNTTDGRNLGGKQCVRTTTRPRMCSKATIH